MVQSILPILGLNSLRTATVEILTYQVKNDESSRLSLNIRAPLKEKEKLPSTSLENRHPILIKDDIDML